VKAILTSIFLLFSSCVLAQTPTEAPPAQPCPSVAATSAVPGKTLDQVHRIFVESFGDDAVSRQMQAMVIASITSSKRFVVTENRSKADAILKGSTTEAAAQEVHAYGSSTNVSTASGGHSASVSGSNGSISGSASGGFLAKAAGIDDSSVNTETIESAKASVRLVNDDGDVIWTSTQESRGAKYKSASVDVADKIVGQLTRDVTKLLSTPAIVETSPKLSK